MPMTERQARGLRNKRAREERRRDLDWAAVAGAITGADAIAVYEAQHALVECWAAPDGSLFGPSCQTKRPRTAIRWSADPDDRCSACQRTVTECRDARPFGGRRA